MGTATNAVLITALGTGKYVPISYHFTGRDAVGDVKTCFPSLAMWKLLDPHPKELWVLLTDEARHKWWGTFRLVASRLGVVNPREIPIKIGPQSDGREVFAPLAKALRERNLPPVVLDITFGFRMLPLAYLLTMTYIYGLKQPLVDKKDVFDQRPVSVYYGAREMPKNGAAPIVDLTPAFYLVDWFYAARTFSHAGALGPFVEAWEANKSHSPSSRAVGEFGTTIRKLGHALDNGLAIEVGKLAKDALQHIRELQEEDFIGNLEPVAHMLGRLQEGLEGLAFSSDKKILDQEELQRELHGIRWYQLHNRPSLALAWSREWLINWVLWREGKTDAGRWLNYREVRRPIEQLLGCLSNFMDDKKQKHGLNELQREVGSLWKSISGARNYYQHAGFADSPSRSTIQVERMEQILADTRPIGLLREGTEKCRATTQDPDEG
ncbi:protein of unknown function [Candidatus Hydrogenisulfobacillus filiaventi]|uniref:CRISPR-associated protein n=1 Tax=Candidatus Hydrogenisulfobacillus filiaventi TaxID=2707344 RepID=A0A6F8ZDT1_9FIRM|nr:TM1812 family CRISPR-associated protein [Bacillota bacterium]CAB1127820.1 protein of unknown function [Candidatus Hydrogenisulfobacillus filiaventi]